MATMTISEAEYIIDVVVEALADEHVSSSVYNRLHYWDCYKPISTLKGYSLPQINTALKLRLANMFLFLAKRNGFEEQFAEEIRICTLPAAALAQFVPDALMRKLKHLAQLSKTLPRHSPEFESHECTVREELAGIDESIMKFDYETSESFADYCRNIGVNDPIYWQKIYTRLGLEYTSSSPRGNDPVYRARQLAIE